MKEERYLKKYSFDFPNELIAQKPASPRDSARLLIYNRKEKKVAFDNFLALDKYLPPRSVIVVNETKVVPARLTLKKETGGGVQVLFISESKKGWEVLSNRKLSLGQTLTLDSQHQFLVVGQRESLFIIRPLFKSRGVFSVLEKYGTTPIPPYIKHPAFGEKKLREEYQSVFAKTKGSVAAPTASLHFTGRLIKKLSVRGHDVRRLTLHVGLGTFASVTKEQLRRGTLHKEYYEISPETARFLNQAKRDRRPIIAVGTTVLRALESASDSMGRLRKLKGETNLFIREGYRFRFVDSLITNFHVPQSSLLMLVSALVSREEITKLYHLAIHEKFKLFSFGDGMLIL